MVVPLDEALAPLLDCMVGLNDLYWLYAPIYQCYLLQARPLIFNPSNLYFVHRVAIAEHYAGGVLKHWRSVCFRLVLGD